ncbi:glycerol-3-phosphate dehydrogenase, partial [Pseudomonas sp. FW305-BF6]
SEEIDEQFLGSVVVLSGPSHAEEVALRHPTTVTSASANMEEASAVQELFSNGYFRVYTNEDVIGVEIGGALKNIIALAAGIT